MLQTIDKQQTNINEQINNYKGQIVSLLESMAEVYKKKSDSRNVIDCYQKAIYFQPDNHNLYYHLAKYLSGQGQLGKACENYQKVLKLHPKSAWGFSGLGNVYFEMGNWSEAINCFEKATEIKNNLPESIFQKLDKAKEYQSIIDSFLPNIRYDSKKKFAKNSGDFIGRIKDVLTCPYNQQIPRIEKAGAIINGTQLMHNGIRVYLDSYYPQLTVPQLLLNKGVHEPEEEAHFLKILERIHSENPTIIELGSYWAFYSMWFMKVKNNASAFMVEPDPNRLKAGQKNFELNNLQGNWTQNIVGKEGIQIDEFVQDKKIDFIDILHSDIQGAELEMLQGARNCFLSRKVGYTFISTHGQKIHMECLKCLEHYGYHIIYSADLYQTRCFDGVIVAASEPTELVWNGWLEL